VTRHEQVEARLGLRLSLRPGRVGYVTIMAQPRLRAPCGIQVRRG
jgi:hypothetical protein